MSHFLKFGLKSASLLSNDIYIASTPFATLKEKKSAKSVTYHHWLVFTPKLN